MAFTRVASLDDLWSGEMLACVVDGRRVVVITLDGDTHAYGERCSYLRVLVPGRCEVTSRTIESVLGRPFRLPGDLEAMMPSFKGRLTLTEDKAVWAFR